MTVYLFVVVEDELSAAVVQRLIKETGRDFAVHQIFNAHGSGNIRNKIERFKNACKTIPHIVLTDLDNYQCPVELLTEWDAITLPEKLLFRIAVKEVETWLLADRNGISSFLGVSRNKIPTNPETEINPKRTLVNIARGSRNKRLAIEITPEIGSSAPIGPFYNIRLTEFVQSNWNIGSARASSDSLDRALTKLANFMV